MRLNQFAAIAGIIGAVAAVIALWPIFFPPPPASPPALGPSPAELEFSTGRIDGDGKSTPDYCDPRRKALEARYPQFDIGVTYLPEQHDDNRDSFGIKHDKYVYSCSFSAIQKAPAHK